MVKTVTNKNVDEVLFEQLKAINFEYLVQLNGLIDSFTEDNGADTLDEEMVTFDTTLNSVVKSRIEELIRAEERVKEIISESREDNKVKFVKEAREYLESLNDMFEGKLIDGETLEIIERLKHNIYNLGTLETQIDVIKTLIEDTEYKDNKTVERAKIAGYLASWEVVREVEQEELDKNREYISAIEIEDDEAIENFIEKYELDKYNLKVKFCGWYLSNKLGLSHIDEIFISEFIENERMCFVFQDSNDFDISDVFVLE